MVSYFSRLCTQLSTALLFSLVAFSTTYANFTISDEKDVSKNITPPSIFTPKIANTDSKDEVNSLAYSVFTNAVSKSGKCTPKDKESIPFSFALLLGATLENVTVSCQNDGSAQKYVIQYFSKGTAKKTPTIAKCSADGSISPKLIKDGVLSFTVDCNKLFENTNKDAPHKIYTKCYPRPAKQLSQRDQCLIIADTCKVFDAKKSEELRIKCSAIKDKTSKSDERGPTFIFTDKEKPEKQCTESGKKWMCTNQDTPDQKVSCTCVDDRCLDDKSAGPTCRNGNSTQQDTQKDRETCAKNNMDYDGSKCVTLKPEQKQTEQKQQPRQQQQQPKQQSGQNGQPQQQPQQQPAQQQQCPPGTTLQPQQQNTSTSGYVLGTLSSMLNGSNQQSQQQCIPIQQQAPQTSSSPYLDSLNQQKVCNSFEISDGLIEDDTVKLNSPFTISWDISAPNGAKTLRPQIIVTPKEPVKYDYTNQQAMIKPIRTGIHKIRLNIPQSQKGSCDDIRIKVIK